MQTFSAVYANVWNADKAVLPYQSANDRFRLHIVCAPVSDEQNWYHIPAHTR